MLKSFKNSFYTKRKSGMIKEKESRGIFEFSVNLKRRSSKNACNAF